MTIEHMAENPTGVTGETSPIAEAAANQEAGQPTVVVAPAARPSRFGRWFGRGPGARVLVEAPTPPKEIEAYTVRKEGDVIIATDPTTKKEIARIPIIAGGAINSLDLLQPSEGFPKFTIEQLWKPEFEAERWRVTQNLMRLEGLTNKELYGNPEKRRQLRDFYKQWKYLESLNNRKSQESKPFDEADLEELTQAGPRRTRYPDLTAQHLTSIPELDAQPPTVKVWSVRHRELVISSPPADQTQAEQRETNIKNAKDYLSRYFKQAHNIGILDSIDDELNSIANEIQHGFDQGLSPGEIMAGKQESYARGTEGTTGVDRRIAVARELGRRAFEVARMANPNITNLEGVWDVYIDEAYGRLTQQLNPMLMPLPPIEGGFRFAAELEGERGEALTRMLEEEGETYWRPTYANYFTIYARSQEQFDIAKKTFIRWARTGLGKDPNEFFGKVNGFKDALTSAGQRAGREMQEYTVEVRQELEAIVGFVVANLFNELYNPDAFKQSWEFIAKTPEGNARMLQLIKTSGGVMAAVLHKLAQDPKLELLHSPHGSRGQLDGAEADRNAIEMGNLQEQILSILTAEVLGISLKRYHPDDPKKRLSNNMYKRNLNEITKFKSDEYFKNLYEGFDLKDQEELYKNLSDRVRALQVQQAIDKGMLDPNNLGSEDHQLYLGKDYQIYEQVRRSGQLIDLEPAEKEALNRLEQARRIQQFLEKGGDPEGLRGEDRAMYEEAKNAVDLAWEIFGAMGEKAQRGGTVYLVDRKDEKDKPFRDFLPDFWARRVCHLVENWTKATYGGELDQEMQDKLKKAQGWAHPNPTGLFANELFYKVGQSRRFAIWQMKAFGRDAKFWDFTLLRDGKPVDINTLGYTKYGENLDAEDEVDRYRYAAPVNERILGYNTASKPVALVFDDQGIPMTLEFKADDSGRVTTTCVTTGSVVPLEYDKRGNAVIYDKPVETQEWSDKEKKLVWVPTTDRKRIIFDNLNENTRAEPLKLKVPKGSIDRKTGKMIAEGKPDEVHVDYDAVVHKFSSHPYARFEGSPYPGYQEQWTGLLLHPDSFADAKVIKAGQLRPEDALPHAVHLLMVDPTLQRVGHFDIVSLEPVVVLANQEESYHSEWRIGDELFMNFYPEDANRGNNRTEYVLQDHGGSTKEWYHMRAQAALWPDARARRSRTFIPNLSVDFGSYPQMYGALGGPLDVFRMMAYKQYKLIGQFAMDKWNAQIHAAQKVLEAAMSDWYNPQEEKMEESLGRKLNNDADTNLKKFYDQIVVRQTFLPKSDKTREPRTTQEDDYQNYLVSARAALDRVERYMHRNTVLQSLFRGERAPLNLEGIEVYKRSPSDGSFELDSNNRRILNPDVNTNRDSGSSRHRNNFFFYKYAKFARSAVYSALYPDTARYLAPLDNLLADYPRLAQEATVLGRLPRSVTGWDWINGKANN